jgi:hypothetical protein
MTSTDATASVSTAFDTTLAFAEEQLTKCTNEAAECAQKATIALRKMSVERATFQTVDAAYLLVACTVHFNDPEFLAARNADAKAFENAHNATIEFNKAHDALLTACSQRRNWEIIVNTMHTGQLVRLNMTIDVPTQILDSLPESEDDEHEQVETENEDDPDDETYQPETEETRPLMSDEDTDDCDSLVHD